MGKVVPLRSQNCFVNLRNFFRNYEGDLFFENVENLIWTSKIDKKIQKMFFLSNIIASEMAVLNCLY